MLKNTLKNAIKDFGGIDELINHRQRKIVAHYNYCAKHYTADSLKALFDKYPSSLRYGGYRNTCYDFRR